MTICRHLSRVPSFTALAILLLSVPIPARVQAQQGQMPDAPVPQQQSASQVVPANTGAGRQTKRILGIVPNFRSVSVDQKLPPQTTKEKFITTTQDSFDYSSFIFVGAIAGVSQLEGSIPQFHTGPPAFARYYWHTFADQTDENYWVEFILPTAFHQDSRYYTLERGNAFKRATYAFTRTLITRGDSGNAQFNASEVIGAGAASGISDLYYPSQERTWTKTGQRWLTSGILDGATFVFKEFWPDINNAVFHQKN